jgi:DNA polymerase IV
VTDRAMLERTLREQADEIAQKLRREDLVGTTVKLKIGWPDFTTPTRQLTFPQPTDESEMIAEAALRLFGQIWTGEQAVRLIGVVVSGLGSPPRQLSLWDIPAVPTPEEQARQQRVEAALAAIQARFGAGAVRRGNELGEP